jgi:SAM-dependent methyltransferase
MRESAYQELHALEDTHWWYRGMRTVYARLLRRYARARAEPVLDVGCGSGGNWPVLTRYGPVIGVDLAQAALELWEERPTGLVQADASRLPFVHDCFSLVTLLGLVEHVENDVGVLREASRTCRQDGIVLVNTSAYMLLWSEHDEANRHVRRYLARDLVRKAQAAGLTPLKVTYANTVLFPAALITRLLQRLGRRSSSTRAPRVDMFPMPGPISAFLEKLLGLEAWLIDTFSLPFGVSILLVLARDQKDR